MAWILQDCIDTVIILVALRWRPIFRGQRCSTHADTHGSIRGVLPNQKKMNASLNGPSSVFFSNGELFIADTYNHRIRKVLQNGQIVTLCGTGTAGYNGDNQPATSSQLNSPISVVVSSNHHVYISERDGHRIRKIDHHNNITTLCGTGTKGYNGDQPAILAQLNSPNGLVVTEDEEVLFCDTGNHCVRKIDRHGIVSVVAGVPGSSGFDGDGRLATQSMLSSPTGVAIHGDDLIIADCGNHLVRRMDRTNKSLLWIVAGVPGRRGSGYNGDDRQATSAKLNGPYQVFLDNDKCIYISDENNHRIRKVLPHGVIKTIAGTGGDGGYMMDSRLATSCSVHRPLGLFIAQGDVYFTEPYYGIVRKIDQRGIIQIIAGKVVRGMPMRGYYGDVEFDFEKYPHVGPRKKKSIKPLFPHALYDIVIVFAHELPTDTSYEPLLKKKKF